MEVITNFSSVMETHSQPFSLLSQELKSVSPHCSGFMKMTQEGPAAKLLLNRAEDNKKLAVSLGVC